MTSFQTTDLGGISEVEEVEMFKEGDLERVQVWVRRVMSTQLSVIVKNASHLMDKVQWVFVRQLRWGEGGV